MNLAPFLPALILSGILVTPTAVQAVCLDPETGLSGYRVALEQEMRISPLILVGTVVKSRTLREDRSDPSAITAQLYSVRVERVLKGPAAAVLEIRSENASSRYAMARGEQHLLFLTRDGRRLFVDGCGNSAALPGAAAVLEQIENIRH